MNTLMRHSEEAAAWGKYTASSQTSEVFEGLISIMVCVSHLTSLHHTK